MSQSSLRRSASRSRRSVVLHLVVATPLFRFSACHRREAEAADMIGENVKGMEAQLHSGGRRGRKGVTLCISATR
ncbi:pyrroloquinoline quinone biosynthesis protein PqqB, partial [Sesbania bispinosa]